MIQKRDKYFINLARQVATGSKCKRASFGAVIARTETGRIVATAYNGKPVGAQNDAICYREGLPPNTPGHLCCLHAEANAILFSAPLERQGATLYVTGQPCSDCTLLILQSGLSRLVYLVVQDGTHPGWSGEDIFEKYGFKGPSFRNNGIEVVPYTECEWEKRYGQNSGAYSKDHPRWCDCDKCVAKHHRRFASEPE